MTDRYESAARPYSAEERAADAAVRRHRAPDPAKVRKRAAPRGRYDQPGNPQSKERDLRLMGESHS
jgi:hypothetical protein